MVDCSRPLFSSRRPAHTPFAPAHLKRGLGRVDYPRPPAALPALLKMGVAW